MIYIRNYVDLCIEVSPEISAMDPGGGGPVSSQIYNT